MKRKTFDNYDYEEAFPVDLDRDIQKKARKNFEKEHPLQVPDYEEQWKEQQEKLKEWELERLLKEGKVESLYRTTTTTEPSKRIGITGSADLPVILSQSGRSAHKEGQRKQAFTKKSE